MSLVESGVDYLPELKLNYENNEENYFSYVPNSLKKHTIKAIDYDIEDDDFDGFLPSSFWDS